MPRILMASGAEMSQGEYRRSIYVRMVEIAEANGIKTLGSVHNIPPENLQQLFEAAQETLAQDDSLKARLFEMEEGKTFPEDALFVESNPFRS